MPVVLPKRPRHFLSRTPVASAVLLALASPALMAQETSVLGEVIVTAQKRSESLQDVPISIDALGEEKMEELNVQNFKDYVQFLPSVTHAAVDRLGLRLQRRVHARRRDRRRRPGDDLAAERRHVPRRAADHDDPGQPRHPPVRHRARRGARRPAGHAVRRELAGGHDPHHHQQAGPVRLRCRLLARRQQRRQGRARLRRRRLRQPAAQRQRRAALRRLGSSTRRAGSTTSPRRARTRSISRRRPTTSSRRTTSSPRTTTTPSDTIGARAALRVNLGDNWTITPSVMYQRQDQQGSWGDDLKNVAGGAATTRSRTSARSSPTTSGTRPGSRSRARSRLRRRVFGQLPRPRRRRQLRLLRLLVLLRQPVHDRLLLAPLPRQRRRPDQSGRQRSRTTTTTRRRATRSASARRRTSACAACSASSTRSSTTTFTRSSAASRASPTIMVMNFLDDPAAQQFPGVVYLNSMDRTDTDQAVFGLDRLRPHGQARALARRALLRAGSARQGLLRVRHSASTVARAGHRRRRGGEPGAPANGGEGASCRRARLVRDGEWRCAVAGRPQGRALPERRQVHLRERQRVPREPHLEGDGHRDALCDLVRGLPAGRHQPQSLRRRLHPGHPDQLRARLENAFRGRPPAAERRNLPGGVGRHPGLLPGRERHHAGGQRPARPTMQGHRSAARLAADRQPPPGARARLLRQRAEGRLLRPDSSDGDDDGNITECPSTRTPANHQGADRNGRCRSRRTSRAT